MSENELLLAVSEMLDKKLCARPDPIRKDISDIKSDVKKINIVMDNEIRMSINLLAENFLSAATRYEKASMETDSIKA